MAELTTLARPYARAAFEHALAGSALGAWADALATAAAVVSDDRAALLLGSPSYTASQKADTLMGVCGDSLPEPVQNFVRVLAENRRLPLLPLAASPAPYGHYQDDEGGVVVPVGAQGGVRGTVGSPTYCGALKVKQVKCENITPQNIGEIMLCNIPSVSTKTAAVIMKKYGTLGALMDALKGSADCLDDIRLETQRKLSKQCIQNIYNFLMG